MDQTPQAETGARIRAMREAAGVTREQLAVAAGLAVRTLAYVEQGANETSVGTLRKIAVALDVPVASLLTEGSAA